MNFMAAVITVFLISITNQFLTSVLGVYFTDINCSVLGAGLHLSIFAIGTLTGKLLLLICPPVPSRNLVRLGMGITILACVGYLFGGIYHPVFSVAVWVSLCRVTQGIGFSLASSASPSLLTNRGEGKLARKVSSYGMATTFAALIGNPIALQIYGNMTKQRAFLLICILILSSSVAACLLCPKTEERVKTYEGLFWKTSPETKQNATRCVGIVFLFFLCSQILTSIFNTLIPVYTNQMGRLELASVFMVTTTVVALLIRIMIPFLLQKKGSKKAILIGSGLYIIGVCCCVFPFLQNVGVKMVLGGIFSGLANGILMSVFHIEMLGNVSRDAYAKVNIIYLLAIDFSMILSGTFWSSVVNHFGIREAFYIAAGLMLLFAISCGMKKHRGNL